MEQNIWIQDGNTFMKGSATTKAHPEGLPKGIYEVKESMTGYYLNRLGDSFVFNYKLYGINNKFIDHFIKTYNNTTGNLGVLFNGIKGTGKTVTAEELCNRIGLPVIIVKSCKEVDDMLKFLATQINFDCIFFFDEYEKPIVSSAYAPSSDIADIAKLKDIATYFNYRREYGPEKYYIVKKDSDYSVIDDFNTGIPGFYNKEDALLVIEHFKEILDKIY